MAKRLSVWAAAGMAVATAITSARAGAISDFTSPSTASDVPPVPVPCTCLAPTRHVPGTCTPRGRISSAGSEGLAGDPLAQEGIDDDVPVVFARDNVFPHERDQCGLDGRR